MGLQSRLCLAPARHAEATSHVCSPLRPPQTQETPSALCPRTSLHREPRARGRHCGGGVGAAPQPTPEFRKNKLREISVVKTGRQSVVTETLGGRRLMESLCSRTLHRTRGASPVQFLTHLEIATPCLLFSQRYVLELYPQPSTPSSSELSQPLATESNPGTASA